MDALFTVVCTITVRRNGLADSWNSAENQPQKMPLVFCFSYITQGESYAEYFFWSDWCCCCRNASDAACSPAPFFTPCAAARGSSSAYQQTTTYPPARVSSPPPQPARNSSHEEARQETEGMAGVDVLLIVGCFVVFLVWVFRTPAIPLPPHKPPKMNHLYMFRGWIPSVRSSQKKAAKFKALTERIENETRYLNAARMHTRARAAYHSAKTKKGTIYYGKKN
jgi:hypothetical protein